MRDYPGIQPASLPDGSHQSFSSRLKPMLTVVDYYLRDISRGVARIQKGQVPDGSGNPIVPNLGDFFFLPGRAGGQVGYGDTNAGGTLTLHSTNNATKGQIFLGSTSGVVFDEPNNRLGLGTASPMGRLHVMGFPASSLQANSDITTFGTQWGTNGAATQWQAILTDDGATSYAHRHGDVGTYNFAMGLNGAVSSTATSWTVQYSARYAPGFTAPTAGTTYAFWIVRSDGNRYISASIDATLLTTTFTTYTTTVSSFSATGVTPNTLTLDAVVPLFFDGYIEISYVIILGVSAGGPTAILQADAAQNNSLTEWQDSSTNVLAKVDTSGNFGVGISSSTPSAVAHFKSRAAANVVLMADSSSGQTGDLFQGIVNSVVFGKLTSAGAWSGRSLLLNGSTSGTLTNTVPATVTSYALTWPAAQGANKSATKNDGSGGLTWGPAAWLDQAQTFTALQTFDASSIGSNPYILSANGGADPLIRFVDAANSANYIELLGPAVPMSGANNVFLPGSGTLVTTTFLANLTAKSIQSGTVGLTAQGADIGTTTITPSLLSTHVYTYEVVLMCTTNDATAGTLTVTAGWTDNVGATTSNVIAGFPLTVTGRTTGRAVFRRASGNITYAVTVTGIYATAKYAILIRLLSLGA